MFFLTDVCDLFYMKPFQQFPVICIWFSIISDIFFCSLTICKFQSCVLGWRTENFRSSFQPTMSSSFSPADNLISFLMAVFVNNRSLLFFNANSQTFELLPESKGKPVALVWSVEGILYSLPSSSAVGSPLSFLLLAWLSFICSGALLWSCLSTFCDRYLQLYDLIKIYLWLAVPSHSCSSSSLPHPLLPLPLHTGSDVVSNHRTGL